MGAPSGQDRRVAVPSARLSQTPAGIFRATAAAAPAATGAIVGRCRRLYRGARRRRSSSRRRSSGHSSCSKHPGVWMAGRFGEVLRSGCHRGLRRGRGVVEPGGRRLQERVKRPSISIAGQASHVVFSSGLRSRSPKPDHAGPRGEQGNSTAAIVLQAASAKNVQFTRAILAEHQWRHILLVSSPYHMRRAADLEEGGPKSASRPRSRASLPRRGPRTVARAAARIRAIVVWWKGWICVRAMLPSGVVRHLLSFGAVRAHSPAGSVR